MKILLRLDRQTSSGCWLTLFLNEKKVGELVTGTQEAKALRAVLGGEQWLNHVRFFEASGDWSGL